MSQMGMQNSQYSVLFEQYRVGMIWLLHIFQVPLHLFLCDLLTSYPVCPTRKSQWVGAKALAKLIKPRKDSSSRERVRSAADLPLPDTPTLDYPDGFPPDRKSTRLNSSHL